MSRASVLVAVASLVVASGAAAADAARGRTLYETRCFVCHGVDANRIGPAHAGVFGRRAGAVPGYDYSPALRAATIVWDARTLDAWLADPERTIPGQKMGVSIGNAEDRADLIAYLRSLPAR